jgi:hypothetical protein
MKATLGFLLLLIGASRVAFARICPNGNCAVPEIDPGLAGSGIALLAGGVLMVLSRRRK